MNVENSIAENTERNVVAAVNIFSPRLGMRSYVIGVDPHSIRLIQRNLRDFQLYQIAQSDVIVPYRPVYPVLIHEMYPAHSIVVAVPAFRAAEFLVRPSIYDKFAALKAFVLFFQTIFFHGGKNGTYLPECQHPGTDLCFFLMRLHVFYVFQFFFMKIKNSVFS